MRTKKQSDVSKSMRKDLIVIVILLIVCCCVLNTLLITYLILLREYDNTKHRKGSEMVHSLMGLCAGKYFPEQLCIYVNVILK